MTIRRCQIRRENASASHFGRVSDAYRYGARLLSNCSQPLVERAGVGLRMERLFGGDLPESEWIN